MTRCEECGFVDEEIALFGLPGLLRDLPGAYRSILAGAADGTVRHRPSPGRWSALEYTCHVRDVLLVQRERVVLACVTDCPQVAPMARDERVALCRYRAQSLSDVLDQLTMAAALLALVFEGLDSDAFDRPLLYNFPIPAPRTVGWVGRWSVHEGRHHLGDVQRNLAAIGDGVGGPAGGRPRRGTR